jgi:hypothetical protein
MVFDSLDSHRLKRPVSNMQRDLSDFDSALAQTVEQLRGEVKTGGGRSYRPSLAGKHGLIALGIQPVFLVPLDVRGKRRAADPIDNFVEVTRYFEANHSAASFAPFDNFSSEFAPRELDACARGQRSAGLHKRLPHKRLDSANKKNFDAPAEHRFASRRPAHSPAYQPCRKHAGVVEHKQVACSEMAR